MMEPQEKHKLMEMILSGKPDQVELAILMMEGMAYLEVCRMIRRKVSKSYILPHHISYIMIRLFEFPRPIPHKNMLQGSNIPRDTIARSRSITEEYARSFSCYYFNRLTPAQ